MAGTLELQFADNNGSFDNRLRHYEGTYISVLLRNARKWSETKNGMDVWRVIRREDNMVIAQSKATFTPADTATSTPAPDVAAQAEPVADAELPFARFDKQASEQAFWDGYQSAYLAETLNPQPATRYFNQRMGYVPVAMRQNRAYTPRSAFSSKPMAKVTLPNMQRRSKPLERKQRPVKPVISIAEVLRSMGIGKVV